ncbi:hypothetical protein [uncultured Tateyamaria sp.]|uniref:hypothetical protein n=1 Tax=uncultured Tateyamaria sp. TaxID=455651 RepID=UPI00261255D8|nr:hypothetical protein [uncultured Tateyamaria sp.]
MQRTLLIPALALMAALAACAPGAQDTTRLDTSLLTASATDVDAAEIEDQAEALNRMARDLVRRSTAKSAAQGALVGCGIAVVTNAPNRCVTGAAAGAATGAIVGHTRGKREVTKRVELVSANALVRSVRGMNGQMDTLQLSLPDLLAEQDAELQDLKIRRDAQALSQADYETSVDAIRQSRARIAEALTATIRNAEQAHANLEDATRQGQDGLDWHLSATSQLAREAHSARSSISLL